MQEKWRRRVISELVSEMILLVDEDGSGQLSTEEFESKVSTDDDVWEIFAAVSPLSTLMKRLKCPVKVPRDGSDEEAEGADEGSVDAEAY